MVKAIDIAVERPEQSYDVTIWRVDFDKSFSTGTELITVLFKIIYKYRPKLFSKFPTTEAQEQNRKNFSPTEPRP